jgi:hypothetical protein
MQLLFARAVLLLPILTVATASSSVMATPVMATPVISQVSQPQTPFLVSQMTQSYCTTYGTEGGIGVSLYDSPNGSIISRFQDGTPIAFNIGDRSGMWAEVTSSDGTTGWVETQWLSCEQPNDESYEDSYSESSDEYDSSDESNEYYESDSLGEEYYEEYEGESY